MMRRQAEINLAGANRFSVIKVLFFCIMVFESEGLITQLVGGNVIYGAWFYAGIMLLSLGLASFMSLKFRSFQEIKYFYYPVIAFAVFFMVSLISANFLFLKDVKDWLPSMYVFTPIFIFYFLYSFRYSSKEIIWGFILVSIFISMLLVIDRLFNLTFLDDYQRRSAFFGNDIRRIVLLKNEVIFGFVSVVSILISGQNTKQENTVLLLIAGILFLLQAFIMESRMGFLAMGVACITLLYIKGMTKKVLRWYVVGFFTVMFLFPMIFKDHIEGLSQMSLHDSASNISIRAETISHFYDAYLESDGWGIGQMSPNASINNILHTSEHRNIVDAGFFSSLFQFGPLGLLIWLVFTYQSLKAYLLYYRQTENRDPYSAAVFAFLMSFTLSLLPLSFFTSPWCITTGGILLYLLWLFRTEMMRKTAFN